MLKIGVLGAGHLGKIHLKLLKEIDQYEVVGFFDPDIDQSQKVESEFQLRRFSGVDELIDQVDAVDIVTPTLSHYECAVKALKKSKHTFIEKPLTNTIEEAKSLVQLTKEASVKVQVGHVERFNPAFTAAIAHFQQPMFIEAHRLSEFNPRGTDVPVVLDLMIHDIDIVLSIVNSSVKSISASGVAVISDSPDIANARIEFDNGCVANLTASRISLKNMRKSRFFQKNAYISVDFLNKELEIVKMKTIEGEVDPFAITIDAGDGKSPRQLFFEQPEIHPNNAIKDELIAFANAIEKDLPPPVAVEDGYFAMDVAYKVIEKLKITSNLIHHSVK